MLSRQSKLRSVTIGSKINITICTALRAERRLNELFGCCNSVGRWRASLLDCSRQELAASLVDVLDGHEFLVPDDLLGAVGCLDAEYAANVFQDAEAVGNVLPEEPGIGIQNHSIRLGRILRKHRELDPAVADVCVEDAFQAAFITDLTIVHGANAFGNRQNLGKLKSWETRE